MLLLLACASPVTVRSQPSGSVPDSDQALQSWTVTVENPAIAYDFPSSGDWAVPRLGPGEQVDATFSAPLGHRLGLLFSDAPLLAHGTVGLYQGREPSPGGFSGGWAELREGELHDVDAFVGLEEFIEVEVSSLGDARFSVSLRNISDGDLLGPGAFVVYAGEEHPLLVAEQPGLASLQDEADVTDLASDLASRTGLTAVFGPGVWAVHTERWLLFQEGASASSGLEVLAEDGDPLPLAQSLANEGERVGVYGPGDGTSYSPQFPGQTSSFTVEAAPGELLSMAFMFSQSNDLFLSPEGGGVPLEEGDLTHAFVLWDAGTEANQEPGFGDDQGPRQEGPNSGQDDPVDEVRPVDDGFDYPEVSSFLQVTVRRGP